MAEGGFEVLGEAVGRAWDRAGRDPDAFVDVALATLTKHPPSALDLDAFVDRALDMGAPLARQLVPLGVFGQPGITAFHGGDFVVDVYFWSASRSAIHDHPFRGAFSVLRGFSVHATYRFDEGERAGDVRFGALIQTGLERVEPFEVRGFGPGRPLIHALLHVPVGAASLVVRTVKTEGYLRYLAPSVALAMHPSDALQRALALLEHLRLSGDPSHETRLRRFFERADLEATLSLLSQTWPAVDASEREALRAMASRHEPFVARFVEALEHAAVVHEADRLRAQLADPDDRFVATGLSLAADRAALLELLRGTHKDPVARLHRFVDDAWPHEAVEVASAHVAHALIDGRGIDGALERLVAIYGAEAVAGHEKAAAAFARTGPFACLIR